MPRKTDVCKPSGLDTVIRNRNAIQDLNRKLKRLKRERERERSALVDEKERLIDEMQAACPHPEIAHCDAVKNAFGPDTKPMRLCVCCGLAEFGPHPYARLNCRRSRLLMRMDQGAYAIKMGQVLRWTGINLPQGA